MSIKIHWGANGSYKSAGAVWDDVVPAIKAGRLVISNIRGMTEERCRSVFPDAPESFKLVAIDMDSTDGLERCRNWFRWAPKGALIIFDETQLIFLKDWTKVDLRQFDYPGGIEAAKRDDVPASWLDAWTRHRHWNWDIVLATPSIKYIRPDIRLTSEGAFRHANFALLGAAAKVLFGDYKETFHDAQLNNPPPKAITKMRRIDKRVFKLYDSTATGKAQDTRAGSSLFNSIPLMVLCATAILALFFGFSGKGVTGWFVTTAKNPVQNFSPAVATAAPAGSTSQQLPAGVGNHLPATKADLIRDFFAKYSAYFVGSIVDPRGVPSLLISFFDKQGALVFSISSIELLADGFFVGQLSDCMLLVGSADRVFNQFVVCRPPQQERVNEKDVVKAGA